MAADKVPVIIQSTLATNGRITSADSDLAVGAQAPPHYHTDFSETFTLISGGMTVFTAPDLKVENLTAQELEVGKPVTIPIGTLHSFIVPKESTKVRVDMEPGTIGFEKVFLIMTGMQEDGTYENFSSMETDSGVLFYAVLADLSNTVFVGEAKEKTDALYALKGPEIEKRKQELVAKYATDEHLRRAAKLTS